jgi:SAM-dependent methyltransferase
MDSIDDTGLNSRPAANAGRRTQGSQMADFTTLSPAEQARQLGKPEGALGLDTALRMNRVNFKITEAVYDHLELAAGMAVLEIGFGNGRLLPGLMRRAEPLNYLGIDISPTMLEQARLFNAAHMAAGRVEFRLGDGETLPAADASFDRAFAVNVIYFWPDPQRQLSEMRRVLKPGGFSVIAATSPETAAQIPSMRREFGFHIRDAEAVAALHRLAGFSHVETVMFEDVVPRPDAGDLAVKACIVIARP